MERGLAVPLWLGGAVALEGLLISVLGKWPLVPEQVAP